MRHQVYEVHININFIAPLRVSCCCVTDVMLLHCGCCTRFELESLFIQWAFICFCQSSTHSSCSCSSSIHLSLKYHVSIGVWSIRKHLLARCFLPTHTERNKWFILTHLCESGYCLQINPNYQVILTQLENFQVNDPDLWNPRRWKSQFNTQPACYSIYCTIPLRSVGSNLHSDIAFSWKFVLFSFHYYYYY